MFGKMMNKYYYGKSGKVDYRKEDLPKNRWQLFWEMLRIRFSGLVRLNLLYMLIWIPTLYIVISTAFSALSMIAVTAAEPMTPELAVDLWNSLYGLVFTSLVILIPCIAITGPFTAGVSYVTRNWARDEHAFIWSDFKDALKENWKQGLVISTITGILPFLVFVGWRFYGSMVEGQGLFFVIPQVLIAVIGGVWSLGLLFFYPLMVTYKLRMKDLLKNGILLAIGRFPQALGIRLITLFPLLLGGLLIFYVVPQYYWVILALAAYYILIGYTLSRFISASFTNSVFDRFINLHIEGVEVNRGLSEYDEDEYDDEDDEGDEE
ncbi:MAG: YesL family protein [Clostridiales bacterium]|nr:YesL family protein [Clostridiales bacterium]